MSRPKQKRTNFKGTKINKSRWGSEPVQTSFLQEYDFRHLALWANILITLQYCIIITIIFLNFITLFSVTNEMGVQFCSMVGQVLLQSLGCYLTSIFLIINYN